MREQSEQNQKLNDTLKINDLKVYIPVISLTSSTSLCRVIYSVSHYGSIHVIFTTFPIFPLFSVFLLFASPVIHSKDLVPILFYFSEKKKFFFLRSEMLKVENVSKEFPSAQRATSFSLVQI